MKISVDGVDLFELAEIQKKVIKNEILSNIFDEDMKRRLKWVVMHKYDQIFKKLKEDWEPKLVDAGVESIPTDKDAFAELVFSQPGYKDKASRAL